MQFSAFLPSPAANKYQQIWPLQAETMYLFITPYQIGKWDLITSYLTRCMWRHMSATGVTRCTHGMRHFESKNKQKQNSSCTLKPDPSPSTTVIYTFMTSYSDYTCWSWSVITLWTAGSTKCSSPPSEKEEMPWSHPCWLAYIGPQFSLSVVFKIPSGVALSSLFKLLQHSI